MITYRGRRAFTLLELLVVLAIIAVLIGLLLPAVQKVRWAAARSQSTNNLHQLILAAHSFHDANSFLPFNGSVDATSADCTSGSWAYQILPYLEQQALYETQPNNLVTVPTPVGPFRCAMRARPGYYTTVGGTAVHGIISSFDPWTTPNYWELSPSPTGIPFSVSPGAPYTFNYMANLLYVITASDGTVSWEVYWPSSTGLTTPAWYGTSTGPENFFMYGIGGVGDVAVAIDGNLVITATSGGTPDYTTGPATDFGINPYINSAAGTLSATNSRQTLNTIPDGTSNTIFLGHQYCPVAEYPLTTASSANARLTIFSGGTDGTSRNGLGDSAATWLQDGTPIALNQWGSPMIEGGLMAMADGSVRLIPYDMPLTNLLNPNDGVEVDLP